jgi:hypothetical protein
MDTEAFVKLILVIAAIFIWLIIKAAKNATEEQEKTSSSKDKKSNEQLISSASRLIQQEYDIQNRIEQAYESDKISKPLSSNKAILEDDKEILRIKNTKSLIEEIESKKNTLKNKKEPSKKEQILLKQRIKEESGIDFNYPELLSHDIRTSKDVSDIKLDLNPKTVLNGIIFKEILERRGHKSYYR